MVPQEEIERFLHGEDDEKYIVAIEYDYKSDKIFNSSPKFNWEVCTEMWNNRHELIGKEATVKYFNLTPDGVPRFPYVIAIRNYE